MTARLFLTGPIGCGKSTLIKTALGSAAARAGGFITVRVREGERLTGFDLLPAACLVRAGTGGRFLTFGENGPVRDEGVFTGLGAELLKNAESAPFAVLDEIGGAELALPEFFAALTGFLQGSVPCVGVLKSAEAAEELRRRVGVPPEWAEKYDFLYRSLFSDENTTVLKTTGRYDKNAENALKEWVEEYVGSV